jgi:hypothetical protein
VAASALERWMCAAVQDVLDRVPTTPAEKLTSLMTLNFQVFDDVSFLGA